MTDQARRPDPDILAQALTHLCRRLAGVPTQGPSKPAVAEAVHDWILSPGAERDAAARQALAKAAGDVVAEVMDLAAATVREATRPVQPETPGTEPQPAAAPAPEPAPQAAAKAAPKKPARASSGKTAPPAAAKRSPRAAGKSAAAKSRKR